jgi:hypothetical protein
MQIYLENEGTTKISDIRKVLLAKDSLAKRNWQGQSGLLLS